jgi:predicted acyl esterase
MTDTVDGCTLQDLDGGYIVPARGTCGTSLAYTTAPMAGDRMLVGPINVHTLLSSTSSDAFVAVRVYDVAPDGSTTPLQWGHQLASRQPLDQSRTWQVNGRITKPWHLNTTTGKQALTPGVVTAVDVEVWPAFALLRTGHAIRVVLTPTPGGTHASGPNALEYAGFAGSVLQIQRSSSAASYVHLALSPVAAFQDVCELCAGRAPAS